MTRTTIAISLVLSLAACGTGGGHSTPIQTNGTNSGGSSDNSTPQEPSKWPSNPIEEDKFNGMQFIAVGGRSDSSNDTVTVTQDETGNITNISLFDNHDDWIDIEADPNSGWASGTRYELVSDGNKFKSNTTYDYSIPFEIDLGNGDKTIDVLTISSDRKLNFEEMKKAFQKLVNTRLSDSPRYSQVMTIIDTLQADNFKVKGQYDLANPYTSDELGMYFIAQRQMTMDIEAYGKSVGLEFANFGKISGKYNIGDIDMKRTYMFAGGIPEHKVDKDTLTGKMQFEGGAVGAVRSYYSDYNGTKQNFMNVDSDAVLTFENGTEILNMNFSDNADPAKRWYDVTFISSGDGTPVRYELSNGDKISATNSEYKIEANDYKVPDGAQTVNSAKLQTEYFGVDNNPSEVTGTATIWKQDYTDTYNHEVEFISAFGTKHTK